MFNSTLSGTHSYTPWQQPVYSTRLSKFQSFSGFNYLHETYRVHCNAIFASLSSVEIGLQIIPRFKRAEQQMLTLSFIEQIKNRAPGLEMQNCCLLRIRAKLTIWFGNWPPKGKRLIWTAAETSWSKFRQINSQDVVAVEVAQGYDEPGEVFVKLKRKLFN